MRLQLATSTLALVLSLSVNSFSLADEFEHYTVPVQDIACKNLDFYSYFRAERNKAGIIRDNLERTKPNFAGKYLLLKNQMMLETEWLVADCATGKFLKARLYGTPTFHVNSTLVIVTPDASKDNDGELPELKNFKDNEWVTVNVSAQPTPAPNSASTPLPQTTNTATDLLQKYESVFAQYPSTAQATACKELDYHSYFRVQNAKKVITKSNPDLSKPNFGGKYLLLKQELLFDTVWFIANCETGKFYPESFTTKHANFKPDSVLVILAEKSPKLMTWVDSQWKTIPDPITTKSKRITNTLYKENAQSLIDALPNPQKKSILRFENLACFQTDGVNDYCSYDFEGKKAVKLPTDKNAVLMPLLAKWGSKNKIIQGRCELDKKPVQCEVETE